MQTVVLFLQENWVLSTAFLVIATVLALFEIKQNSSSLSAVEPLDVVSLMNRNQACVLDIRPKELYSQGHILDSVSSPFEKGKALGSVQGQVKTKPVILVSHPSQATHEVAKQLQEQGFSQVVVLAGGVPAWQAAQLPLHKSTS